MGGGQCVHKSTNPTVVVVVVVVVVVYCYRPGRMW
jgi:hypothetical protein